MRTSGTLSTQVAIYLILLLGGGQLTGDSGVINVKLCGDPGPMDNAWPDQVLLEYEEVAFAFSGVPQAYTENGIRDDWSNPFRVIAEVEVELPKGHHRILLRSRRASRLWMDGRLIAENPHPSKISDGHDPVERPFIPLGPGVRFPGPDDMEKLVEVDTSGKPALFRFEFYVGGWAGKLEMRSETGETLVAVSPQGESGFQILSPGESIALTNKGWKQFYDDQQGRLTDFNERRRRSMRAGQADYWKKRHAWAREWVNSKEEPVFSSIDDFLNHRIESVNEVIDASPEAVHFEGLQKQHVLIKELDLALSALIRDLEAKGKLDETLIVVGTEFGRPADFDTGGGRGHYGRCFSLILAGGGLKHQGAYGVTDDLAQETVEHPVSVPDFHATAHAALGINPAKELYAGDRPVPITDGGTPIASLI